MKITFTGDVGFDKYMNGKWEDEGLLSKEILTFLADSDHIAVNVEGPLSQQKKTVNKNGVEALTHTMNPEAVKFFKRINSDIWNICNNHICDAGADGILDTLSEAKKAKAYTLGAGMDIKEASRPLIFKEAGGIGLISVGYQRACRKADDKTPGCFSWSDLDLIKTRIEEIKKENRWCVVIAHAGEEFTCLPTPYTRDKYLKYLEFGADIIVAHHPHVPMNYELIQDEKGLKKAIFYSLGNFVFDTDYQRSQFNTEKGIILKINFSETDFTYDALGIKIDRAREKIIKGDLPKIFTDVPEAEYKKLVPLSAKAFIQATKRQLKFLRPEEFMNAGEEEFMKNFYEPMRSGRVPGETLDFQIIVPLALESEKGEWKESSLKAVKEYILEQI